MSTWPVDNAESRVTQEFGQNPNAVQPGGHTGIDFKGERGTPIYAPDDGVVVFACWANDLGWPNPYYIATSAVIPHPDGAGIVLGIDTGPHLHIVAHLNDTNLNPGDHVKQGDLVAHMGDTGYAFGVHAHYEILPDGWDVTTPTFGRINPRSVIDGVVKSPPPPVLAPNERMVGSSPVNQRKEPNTSSEIIRVIPPNTKEVWDGYVHGEEVNWNGAVSDLWFKDSTGYASILFFDPTNVDGLSDLQPAPPPPPPAPVPLAILSGVDVSSNNKVNDIPIDLTAISYDFIGIKASEGVGYTDPGLAEKAEATKDKKRIFYHYARPNATPDNTAAAEATYFLEVVRPYLREGDVLSLDWERNPGNPALGIGPNDVADTQWALKFLRIIQGATQGIPLHYMNGDVLNSYSVDWVPVENEFPLWYAAYPSKPDLNVKPNVTWAKGLAIWQYTSTGKLAGYHGYLDLNLFYGNIMDWVKLGITRIPPEPGPTGPVPIPFPSKEQPISDLLDYYDQQSN